MRPSRQPEAARRGIGSHDNAIAHSWGPRNNAESSSHLSRRPAAKLELEQPNGLKALGADVCPDSVRSCHQIVILLRAPVTLRLQLGQVRAIPASGPPGRCATRDPACAPPGSRAENHVRGLYNDNNQEAVSQSAIEALARETSRVGGRGQGHLRRRVCAVTRRRTNSRLPRPVREPPNTRSSCSRATLTLVRQRRGITRPREPQKVGLYAARATAGDAAAGQRFATNCRVAAPQEYLSA